MTVTAERDVLTKVADVDAHEGPVWLDGALYFTSLPRHERPGHPVVDIRRLVPETGEVMTVRADANAANGMTLAPDGRLLVCEQGTMDATARISAVDPATGAAETVVDRLAGLALNSPNDVVVRRDGTIWFTDPSYGFLQGFKPEPAHGDFVHRFDPATGRLTVVASDFDKPNGLAFSPDETVLYIGDSGANHEPGSFDPRRPHHIRAFDVIDNRLVNGRLFAVTTPGFPDGIKVDADGRVYASAFSGVQVFDPAGELVDEIALTGAVNFTFGGESRDSLFITTDTAVWAAVINAKGA
jgi:gluconolactonase